MRHFILWSTDSTRFLWWAQTPGTAPNAPGTVSGIVRPGTTGPVLSSTPFTVPAGDDPFFWGASSIEAFRSKSFNSAVGGPNSQIVSLDPATGAPTATESAHVTDSTFFSGPGLLMDSSSVVARRVAGSSLMLRPAGFQGPSVPITLTGVSTAAWIPDLSTA